MSVKSIVVGVALALFVVGGLGAAYAVGYGPAPGDSGDGIDGEFPTETTTTDEEAATGEETANDTTTTDDAPAAPAFAVSVTSVEDCGTTCRKVTVALANDGGDATNVTVYSRIFVGQGTDGDVVWADTEAVGSLEVGDTHTTTKRVELSYSEGYDVRQADGWVTIQTTIVSDEKTATFTEQRQVG